MILVALNGCIALLKDIPSNDYITLIYTIKILYCTVKYNQVIALHWCSKKNYKKKKRREKYNTITFPITWMFIDKLEHVGY